MPYSYVFSTIFCLFILSVFAQKHLSLTTQGFYFLKLISEGWNPIKTPSNFGSRILLSVPFMLINGFLLICFYYFLYPTIFEGFEPLFSDSGFSIALNIDLVTMLELTSLIVLILIHEFIYACFIPGFLKSDEVYWGINLLYAFVYTTKKIKKESFIVNSIMPLLLISILLPIVLSIFGCLNQFILFLCFVNSISSSVDCLKIYTILKYVPNKAYIVSNGNEAYYKL